METKTGILIQTMMTSDSDRLNLTRAQTRYSNVRNRTFDHTNVKFQHEETSVGLFLQERTELTLFWRSGRTGGAFVSRPQEVLIQTMKPKLPLKVRAVLSEPGTEPTFYPNPDLLLKPSPLTDSWTVSRNSGDLSLILHESD